MSRRLFAAGILAILLGAASPADAASITFQSRDVSLTSGDFMVDIVVEGLEEDVLGFQFNFAFDNTILALGGITEGSFLSQDGQNGETIFDTTPVSNDFQTVTSFLLTGQTGNPSGTLATLTFRPLAIGGGVLEAILTWMNGTS